MIRLFGQYFSIRKIVFILGEGILIYIAVVLSAFFLIGTDFGLRNLLEIIWFKVLVIAFVTQISLYFNDLYENSGADKRVDLATRLVQSVGITSILLAVIYFFWPDIIIGRWIFFASIIIMLFFVIAWRLLYALVIRKKFFSEKVLMVGAGELAGDIIRELEASGDVSYDIRSIIGHDREKESPNQYGKIPVYYGFSRLGELAEQEQAMNIIVAMDEKRGLLPFRELLDCKLKGISIIDGESFYERIAGKILVERINPSWLIFSDGFKKSGTARIVKRLTGFLLSIIMLVFLAPLMALVALMIRAESRGPVIFSQERSGEGGKVFTLYKFRSMRADAEKESGPMWASEDDPRITRVGKIIRKLRIDELPQLWNVFKGDMSFVGPRPERPFFVKKLLNSVPYYHERFSVKPGITGWAQIKYPYGSSEEDALEKLKYDLYYIKNLSLFMDLAVIFHTVKIVLLGRGSR